MPLAAARRRYDSVALEQVLFESLPPLAAANLHKHRMKIASCRE
jgi:hypothetical protein